MADTRIICVVTSLLFYLVTSVISWNSCLWLFDTCFYGSKFQCKVRLRNQCPCADGIHRTATDPRNTSICSDIDHKDYQEARAILLRQKSYPVRLSSLCDLRKCRMLPVWCPWGEWKPYAINCTIRVYRSYRQKCCHPVTKQLVVHCYTLEWRNRTRKARVNDCLRTSQNYSDSYNGTDGLGEVSSSTESFFTQDPKFKIGLVGVVFVCLLIFPYKHIYRLFCSRSPNSSECSTPPVYEQVPMEQQNGDMQTIDIEQENTQTELQETTIDAPPLNPPSESESDEVVMRTNSIYRPQPGQPIPSELLSEYLLTDSAIECGSTKE